LQRSLYVDACSGISARRNSARIDGRDINLLTRTGLDWSHRYRRTIEALGSLRVKSAYLDGELCALNFDGVPVFSRLQAATFCMGIPDLSLSSGSRR